MNGTKIHPSISSKRSRLRRLWRRRGPSLPLNKIHLQVRQAINQSSLIFGTVRTALFLLVFDFISFERFSVIVDFFDVDLTARIFAVFASRTDFSGFGFTTALINSKASLASFALPETITLIAPPFYNWPNSNSSARGVFIAVWISRAKGRAPMVSS